MKDFRENSHREHLYLTIDASPKELVSSIYRPVHARAAAEGTLRSRHRTRSGTKSGFRGARFGIYECGKRCE